MGLDHGENQIHPANKTPLLCLFAITSRRVGAIETSYCCEVWSSFFTVSDAHTAMPYTYEQRHFESHNHFFGIGHIRGWRYHPTSTILPQNVSTQRVPPSQSFFKYSNMNCIALGPRGFIRSCSMHTWIMLTTHLALSLKTTAPHRLTFLGERALANYLNDVTLDSQNK